MSRSLMQNLTTAVVLLRRLVPAFALCLCLVAMPGLARADDGADVDFIIEFSGLGDVLNDFDALHDGARRSLQDWYASVSAANDFRGQKRFSAALKKSGSDYREIADRAAGLSVSDPRNVKLVLGYLAAGLVSAELYPLIAKCARNGNKSFCTRIFKDVEGKPTFEQAMALRKSVRDEADKLVTALEAKYGSFDAARSATNAGGGKSPPLTDPADAPVLLDIEAALSRLGYDPGPIDGVFDDQSEAALSDLIRHSEGVFPEDADGLMGALDNQLQNARDFPEDRDWGDNPDLNRKIAEATGYLGGFSGNRFTKWVKRQPRRLRMGFAVAAVKQSYNKAKQAIRLSAPKVSNGEILATINAPVAAPNNCDRLAADIFDENAVSAGVALWDIDSGRAISACEKALRAAPSESRFAFQLARAHVAAGQADKARPVFAALAANGHAPSIAHLGYLDYQGLAGPSDLASARKLLAAAAQNSDLALSVLVDMLRSGDGGPRDPREAARWLKTGIERSQNPAMKRTLAAMFDTGDGVEKNVKLAAMLRNNTGGLPSPQPAATVALPIPLPASKVAVDREPPAPEYDAPAPTVLVPDGVIFPGTAPKLVYAGLPPTGQHWVAVSAPGLEGKTYYFLKMLEKGQTDGEVTGPELPAGKFEARLFLNWPEDAYTIVDTAPITVAANAAMTLRRRQLVVELETYLAGADVPDLMEKLRLARSGEVAPVRTVALGLIAKATRYAAISAELGEVDPLAMAMEMARYGAELMPEDAEIIRMAGVLYLAAPAEAGLLYDAEGLLGYAVTLNPDDRLARRLWIEALVLLTRYDAAQRELKILWPAQEGEARLIGLVSDVYIAIDQPKAGLALLRDRLPQSLTDAATLARATLSFAAGDKRTALTLARGLASSPTPYFAAIGRNLTRR